MKAGEFRSGSRAALAAGVLHKLTPFALAEISSRRRGRIVGAPVLQKRATRRALLLPKLYR